MAQVVETLSQGGPRADRLQEMVQDHRPDLRGGRSYVDSPRHRFYVTEGAYRKTLRSVGKEMGWGGIRSS